MDARYARNILLDGIGSAGQDKLCKSRVLVVGMGGVGCHVAVSLAGLGMSLGICDHDKVEKTNLNRQFLYCDKDIGKFKVDAAARKLNVYNPHIRIGRYKSLKEINLAYYKAVVDCTDNVKSRVAISMACEKSGVPLVYASAVGYTARVSTFTKKYLHNHLIVGRGENGCEALGIFPPAAAVAGSIAVSEATKVVLGVGSTLENKMLIADLKSNKIRIIRI